MNEQFHVQQCKEGFSFTYKIREISKWYKTVCVHGEIGRYIKQLFYLSVVGELNHVVTMDRSVLFFVTTDQESAESIHMPFLQLSSFLQHAHRVFQHTQHHPTIHKQQTMHNMTAVVKRKEMAKIVRKTKQEALVHKPEQDLGVEYYCRPHRHGIPTHETL